MEMFILIIFLTRKDKKLLINIIHDNFKNEISLPMLDKFNIEVKLDLPKGFENKLS